MALLPFAVPDCGLATIHINGKKVNKFWITLALHCNTDGSQKFPIFYIGRARHPVAFNRQDPNQAGFHYCHNKMVWMTSAFFDEWVPIWSLLIATDLTWRYIRELDIKMGLQNWKIILLLDNFGGHNIDYSPTNIRLVFFTPNMTAFIQSLDVGSSAVSKPTIGPCSVDVPWISIQSARIIYSKSTFTRPC